MDLSAIWSILCGPWGPLLGAAAALIVERLGLKLPFKLPSVPNVPTPGPLPALPVLIPNPDGSPKFPLLRSLIDSFFRSRGERPPADLADLPAAQVSSLWSEVDSLCTEKAERHKAEVRELE
jgi:hypothetical protein